MKLVECVPNFSEGRRPEVVRAITDSISALEGTIVLDVSSDESHNRTVVTFVVPLERAVDAAFAGIREARERIDLTVHKGEHPRMGATDVVPFVPLESTGTTMDDCITLARQLGERVGAVLEIPVYLYERAATRPERANLANVRRGEFESIRDEIGHDPARDPDFGPKHVHPTAGAIAIGARPFLIAYNVYLGNAAHLQIAKNIAKAVRASSGGLPGVKALGLEVDGQSQVSMNLVDMNQTPMHAAFEAVSVAARTSGIEATWSEIVGLVPERALFDAAANSLKLNRFTPDQVLERRLRPTSQQPDTLAGWMASVAAATPTPGGGSVAATAGAMAAALVQMVAGLTVGKKKYAAVEVEFRTVLERAASLVTRLSGLAARDAASYERVTSAYQLPKESNAERSQREAAVAEALIGASEVPLETARACSEVVDLAEIAALRGNSNAASDAGVAALLAGAACRGAAYNVIVNVASLSDRNAGKALEEEVEALARKTDEGVARVKALVDDTAR
ncbi:MAG: glutamate formimidoyltransferase [Gemmatimonadaceae bacterium]